MLPNKYDKVSIQGMIEETPELEAAITEWILLYANKEVRELSNLHEKFERFYAEKLNLYEDMGYMEGRRISRRNAKLELAKKMTDNGMDAGKINRYTNRKVV